MRGKYFCSSTSFAIFSPTQGSSGQKIQLYTNYFNLISAPNWLIYQYRVDFSPEIDSKGMRSRFVKDHKELLGPVRSFDGYTLYLPRKLPDKV